MLHREQPIRHSAYKTPHARHMYIQRVRQNTCALFSLCLYNDITLCLFSPQLHAMACSVHARQLSLACDSTSHIYKTAKLREALQALYNESKETIYKTAVYKGTGHIPKDLHWASTESYIFCLPSRHRVDAEVQHVLSFATVLEHPGNATHKNH